MRGGLVGSLIFHAVVVFIAYFGLPYLALEPALIDAAIIVDVVNVAEKSNPPPVPPGPEKPKELEKVETLLPPPEPPEQLAPPSPPEPVSEPELEPQPKPEPKPEPEPEPEPKPDPKPEPKPEPKPDPKPKFSKRKPPKKPKPPDRFASVLKTLEELKQKPRVQPPKKADKPLEKSKLSFKKSIAAALKQQPSKRHNPAQPLSISEIDMVRRQISRCWNLPAGAKGAKDLNIAIYVIMNRDGTVREAKVMDPARMTSDAFFRISAEAARRAVLNPKCNPLKLPSEKFEQWQTMTLNFNPRDMF